MKKISKSYVQHLLKKLCLYHRLKASYLYDLYWIIVDRRIIESRYKEIKFYRNTLKGFKKKELIFDIGANHGQKTDIFLRMGAKVLAVEPDTLNQLVLHQKFLQWRFLKKEVIIVGKAVSDQNKIETMYVASPGSAFNTLSQKWINILREDQERIGETTNFTQQQDVETVTLEHLITTYGMPFFVKIDVEGYEPNVLRGLQRPIPYISFEVNLPEFRPEGLQCIELLRRIYPKGKFNYTANSQAFLMLDHWLDEKKFMTVFEKCRENSLEVFWQSNIKD